MSYRGLTAITYNVLSIEQCKAPLGSEVKAFYRGPAGSPSDTTNRNASHERINNNVSQNLITNNL